ncbi:MAG: hypothetical protein MUC56_13575 [Thermoanaerobaculales bacterium]|jgi:photosystem II stability/assembly factor-like uncharacterized protein|nr:hypothetical protein [Thermoanaerobaculales bacterium]
MPKAFIVATCLLLTAAAAAEVVDEQGLRPRLGPRLDVTAAPGAEPRAATAWVPLGPFGGDVDDVAASPTASGVVLAGLAPYGSSGGTMFRSTDGGATWVEVAGFGVSTYDVEFTAAGVAYAGTEDGVFASTDDGATWTPLPLGIGLNDSTREVTVDPADPTVLWAGVDDHTGAQAVNVLRSTDAGATWQNVTPPLATPMSCLGIAVDPTDSSRVWAAFGGTFGGGAVWRSTDGGATWANRSAGLPNNPMNVVVHDGTRVLVGGGQRFGSQYVGLYASDNDGVTWTPLHDGTWPLLVVSDVELDPANPSVILAATEASGVHRSTDGGDSWAVSIGGSDSFSLASVRFDPASAATIFLGASSLGVVRSLDGGGTFNVSSVGIGQLDVHSVAANPNDRAELAVAFQGLNDGGVYTSTDGGALWTLEGCPGTRYNLVSFAQDGRLYAISDGPSSTAPEALYRRELDGTWTYLGPNQGTAFESELHALRFSATDPSLLLMGGNDFGVAGWEGTVWRSTDTGATWAKAYEGTEDYESVTDIEIVEDGTDTKMVACFQDLASGPDAGALRSDDGGLNWFKSSAGLPPSAMPYALSPTPGSPSAFLLASGGPDTGLYRTTDGGQSWAGTGFAGADLRGVVAHPDRPGVVYVAQNGTPKALRSPDGGTTFAPCDDGLGGAGLPSALAFAAGTPDLLLLATSTGTYAREVEQALFTDDFETGGTTAWSLAVP